MDHTLKGDETEWDGDTSVEKVIHRSPPDRMTMRTREAMKTIEIIFDDEHTALVQIHVPLWAEQTEILCDDGTGPLFRHPIAMVSNWEPSE